ncbi:MAG: hypothetical protein QW695_07040, partial [Candidatus Bathyarchaeia archaeon]
MTLNDLGKLRYRFEWIRIPVFTVECLRKSLRESRITLDLGLSWIECKILDNYLHIGELRIDISSIDELRDERAIYILEDNVFKPIAFWGGNHFYKLVS